VFDLPVEFDALIAHKDRPNRELEQPSLAARLKTTGRGNRSLGDLEHFYCSRADIQLPNLIVRKAQVHQLPAAGLSTCSAGPAMMPQPRSVMATKKAPDDAGAFDQSRETTRYNPVRSYQV
jgi:hypothetical protein